jgi:hypothetical protein
MTHRQALTQIASKIIHISVQLCLTSCCAVYCCVSICFDILLNTVFFCMNCMWNAVPLESVGESFVVNFPRSQYLAQQTSINFVSCVRLHRLLTVVKFIYSYAFWLKSSNTLTSEYPIARQTLLNIKLPRNNKKQVHNSGIYKLLYKGCDNVFIGQTDRSFSTRY